MALILTWHDDWSLGIEPLDEDHREIVDRLTEIARCYCDPESESVAPADEPRAIPGDCGDLDLCATLDGFGAFVKEHFRREEEFMRAIDYPGFADHRSEHALLMAEYTEMVRDLRAKGVRRIDFDTLQSLKHWVVAHMLGEDRSFAELYFSLCGGEPGGV